MKTFKEIIEGKKYEIKVEIGSAKKAQEALNDELRGTYKQAGSDVFVFKREDDAVNALYTLKSWGVEVRDSDVEDWEDILDEAEAKIPMYSKLVIKNAKEFESNFKKAKQNELYQSAKAIQENINYLIEEMDK